MPVDWLAGGLAGKAGERRSGGFLRDDVVKHNHIARGLILKPGLLVLGDEVYYLPSGYTHT